MIARQGKMIDWLLLAPLPYQSDGMRHVATGFNKSALDTAPIIFALLDLSGSLHQRVFFFAPFVTAEVLTCLRQGHSHCRVCPLCCFRVKMSRKRLLRILSSLSLSL